MIPNNTMVGGLDVRQYGDASEEELRAACHLARHAEQQRQVTDVQVWDLPVITFAQSVAQPKPMNHCRVCGVATRGNHCKLHELRSRHQSTTPD